MDGWLAGRLEGWDTGGLVDLGTGRLVDRGASRLSDWLLGGWGLEVAGDSREYGADPGIHGPVGGAAVSILRVALMGGATVYAGIVIVQLIENGEVRLQALGIARELVGLVVVQVRKEI